MVCALALLSGCASYTENLRRAQRQIIAGRPRRAIHIIDKQLDVDTPHNLPANLKGSKVLLLLERGTLLQALGEYKLSSHDMMVADQRLEWLDIANADTTHLAKYLYSGSATLYRAPAYERLLLNTLNMLNFLCMGDLEDARVEARRFQIMETFFVDNEGKSLLPGLMGLGNYLAGATFEASGDYQQATRYYGFAWYYGIRTPELRVRLVDLFRVTGYGAREILVKGAPGVAAIKAEAAKEGTLTPSEYREAHQIGDTLVVVQTGIVPYKKAVRFPFDIAMGYADRAHYDCHRLDDGMHHRAHVLFVNGVLNWVNFPQLTDQGLPPARSVHLLIDKSAADLVRGMNVRRQVEDAWNRIVPDLMAAAITRYVTRAVVGNVTDLAVNAAARAGGAQGDAAGALGWLVGLAVKGTMAAADVPDTRSWTTLPAHIRLARLHLTRGLHRMAVRVDGRIERKTVGIYRDRFNVVNFSRLR